MEIVTSSNNLTIAGNIKTVNDFQEIKLAVDTITAQNKNITIFIKDSLSITSSVIGYFNKIVLKDKVNLSMKIGNEKLLELIKDLNLASTFKAKKV